MKICGFSLLELLIVMAIVGILIALATPLYTSHLIKSRRNLAEISLFHLASQLENFYSLNDSYQGASLEGLAINAYTDDHCYQLNIQSATADGYLIEAIPQGPQAIADKSCGTLLLDERNQKSNSGKNFPQQCWQ